MRLNPGRSDLLHVVGSVTLVACSVLILQQITRSHVRGNCSDFTFRIALANRTASTLWKPTIHALNPKSSYTDFPTITFHNDPTHLQLNNADCQLKLSGVRRMSREQLQNLKPHVLHEAILRSRSRHLAYFDWDANWIRWPARPRSGLVVQGTPGMTKANTGLFAFFDAREHLPLLARWASFEHPGKHDQDSWHMMEHAANREGAPVRRTLAMDGVVSEHYNWNAYKPRTVVRCRRLIAFVRLFRTLANALIALAVTATLYDAYSLRVTGKVRPRVALVALFLVAVVASVIFRADYQHHNGIAPRIKSVRLCAIPETALKRDGSIVTRQSTTSGRNMFLASMIASVGFERTATALTLWFVVLERLRAFARVFIAMELLSLLSVAIAGARRRPESLMWSACAQLLDVRKVVQ